MATLTDNILNDPNSQDPNTWLTHMDAALASDPKKDEKIAQALRAYLEAAAPKTLQELLQLSKTKASEAQVWISILPPDTKAQFVSEIQSAISAITPASQPQTKTGTSTDASKVDLRKWFVSLGKSVSNDEPSFVGPSVLKLLLQIQGHNKLNTKMPGTTDTWYDEIVKLIHSKKAKFKDEDFNKVNQTLVHLQDREEPITESYDIASQIKVLMHK